jgi:hypothetical protein
VIIDTWTDMNIFIISRMAGEYDMSLQTAAVWHEGAEGYWLSMRISCDGTANAAGSEMAGPGSLHDKRCMFLRSAGRIDSLLRTDTWLSMSRKDE